MTEIIQKFYKMEFRDYKFSAIFENSEEKTYYKAKLIIEKIISSLSDEDKQEAFLDQILEDTSNNKNYFGKDFVSNLIKTLTKTGLDVLSTIKLLIFDHVDDEYLGKSVAISKSKIVVGAFYDVNDENSEPKNVYVYDLDGTNEIKLTPPDESINNHFGYSVAVSDSKIVIGAYGDDEDSIPGSAYVYDLDGSNRIKLTASDGFDGNYFGHSVAVSDSKIVIGAFYDSEKGIDSGSAYVYDLDGSNEIKITASDGAINEYFGYSVAVSDSKIVVGVPYDNENGPASGSVYVYDLDGTNEIKITASDETSNEYFGSKVAISGTKILVKTLDSVYIYNLDGTNEIKPDSNNLMEEVMVLFELLCNQYNYSKHQSEN